MLKKLKINKEEMWNAIRLKDEAEFRCRSLEQDIKGIMEDNDYKTGLIEDL